MDHRVRLFAKLGKQTFHRRAIEIAQPLILAANDFKAHRRQQEADRRANPCPTGYDDAFYLELARQLARVQRCRAAVRNERTPAIVLTPLHGMCAGSGHHVLIDHLGDTHRALLDTHRQHLGDVVFHHAPARILIELQGTARKQFWPQLAQQHVGICHRGRVATASVRCGTGLRPSAFGTYGDARQLIDSSDRTATRPDFHHLDDGYAHGQA